MREAIGDLRRVQNAIEKALSESFLRGAHARHFDDINADAENLSGASPATAPFVNGTLACHSQSVRTLSVPKASKVTRIRLKSKKSTSTTQPNPCARQADDESR